MLGISMMAGRFPEVHAHPYDPDMWRVLGIMLVLFLLYWIGYGFLLIAKHFRRFLEDDVLPLPSSSFNLFGVLILAICGKAVHLFLLIYFTALLALLFGILGLSWIIVSLPVVALISLATSTVSAIAVGDMLGVTTDKAKLIHSLFAGVLFVAADMYIGYLINQKSEIPLWLEIFGYGEYLVSVIVIAFVCKITEQFGPRALDILDDFPFR